MKHTMTDTSDAETADRAARHQVPSLGLTGERGERLHQAWKRVWDAQAEYEAATADKARAAEKKREQAAKEAFAV